MKSLKVLTIAAIAFTATQPALAGGLFGDGGLIRGDVGKFFDKHLEKPITTPLARAGTVAAGTAAGTVLGGKIGQPAIGGAIGFQMGNCVNDIFAGGNCGTRPQPQQMRLNTQRQQLPRPAVQFGNYCATPNGVFGPGPMNPVGSFCQAYTPYGVMAGRVTN